MSDQREARFTILGDCASKANSRKAVLIGGKPSFIKSDKARGWISSATRQFPGKIIDPLFAEDVVVFIKLIYATRRPDLDPSLVFDWLQGRVFENDRQIKEFHAYHGIDKINPRVEIVVREI